MSGSRAGHVIRWVGLLILSLQAGRVQGEGGLLLIDPVPATPQRSLGATLLVLPRYPGSTEFNLIPLPGLEYFSPAGWFFSTDVGLGWNLSHRADVQMGVRLYPILPRRSGEGARLRGVPDIPLRLERTMFANWSPVPYATLQSSLRTGFGGDQQGVLFEAGASAGAPLRPDLLAGITLGMSYANASYRQSLFGVDSGALAHGGPPPFQAGAGWQDVQTALGVEWTLQPRWRLVARLQNSRLLGAAAASPLTGARWQHGLYFSIWHDLPEP